MCFRLLGTMELLWKSRVNMLPQVSDKCIQVADGVEIEYEVESIRTEFYHSNVADIVGYDQGVPIQGPFEPSVVTEMAPVVLLSLV